jgi:hypothetical protein
MRKNVFLMCLTIVSLNVVAAPDWEKEFQNVCSYDPNFCQKLKNTDGTFTRPKKEIVGILKELAPTIKAAATKLGVDPQAIAGAIMAENSLNVGISDKVQNLLVSIGVANKGEVLGKKFSYGLGQLNFAPAREAENYVASLEGRKPLSDQELTDAILIPEKAVYLVGAVIKKAQDDYKKQGMDISNQPDILTTLYNLGGSERKALESKAAGRLPRPNFFGYFVKKYLGDLSFVKNDEPKAVVGAVNPKPTVASVSANNSTANTPAIEKKLKLAFTKSMPLYLSPPTCADENGSWGGPTNIQSKYKSMKNFPVSTIAEKDKTFNVVAPSVDCEANGWALIKLNTGETGWIKKDELEKNTAKVLIADVKCKTNVDLKCTNNIKDQLKDLAITEKVNSKTTELYAKPYSNSGKYSFARPDWECRAVVVQKQSQGAYQNNNLAYTSYPLPGVKMIEAAKNSMKDLSEVNEVIKEKMKAIEKKYDMSTTDPLHPLVDYNFAAISYGISNCINRQKYNLSPCQMDAKGIVEFVKSINIDRAPNTEEKKFFFYNSNLIATNQTPVKFDDFKSTYLPALQNGYNGNSGNRMTGSYPGMNTGSFGIYGGSYGGLGDQYALRVGDENKWKIDDVENALKSCSENSDLISQSLNNSKTISSNDKYAVSSSMSQINTNSVAPALQAIEELKKLSGTEYDEKWKKAQPYFIQLSKLCLGMEDLYDVKKDTSKVTGAVRDYKCFFQDLKVLDNNLTLAMKDVMKETMLTQTGSYALLNQFNNAYNRYVSGSLGLLPKVAPVQQTAYTPTADDNERMGASFCPNKTAEMIEELLKNNSCIQTVYLPDRWMLNRLNEFGNKVQFRPFAETDRYAIEVEKTQCN